MLLFEKMNHNILVRH